jgi:hypothetical protein
MPSLVAVAVVEILQFLQLLTEEVLFMVVAVADVVEVTLSLVLVLPLVLVEHLTLILLVVVELLVATVQ